MDHDASTRRVTVAALVIAVVLVAANMRPTITSVGPLLPQIGDDTGLSPAALGLLGAVPLLAWGAFSPLAHVLSRRFGMARSVLWSLVLLTAGTVVRSLPGVTIGLWLGTVLIGAALAVANVLMPAVVKRDFVRVPLVMSIYTAVLGGFGAIASGVAVPISHAGPPDAPAGWRISLLVIGVALLPFAALAWGLGARRRDAASRAAADRPTGRTGIWRDAVAWQVAGYMGLQSASFYMLVTWLATIAASLGRSAVIAGLDVMVFQIFSVVGSLLVPLTLRAGRDRFVPAAIPVLGILGTAGLMLAPGTVEVWAAVIGLFSGASLGMSLTLLAQRARHHDSAAALSGMAQSVGYLVAACGPVLFGWLHSLTDGWTVPFTLLLAVMIGQGVIGLFAGRDRYVLGGR